MSDRWECLPSHYAALPEPLSVRGLGFGPRRHHFPALTQCGGPYSWRQYPDVLQYHRRQVQQWAGTEEQSTRFMCRVHGVDNALMCANAGLSPPTFSHSRVLLLLSHSPTHLAGFVLVLVCSLLSSSLPSTLHDPKGYRVSTLFVRAWHASLYLASHALSDLRCARMQMCRLWLVN